VSVLVALYMEATATVLQSALTGTTATLPMPVLLMAITALRGLAADSSSGPARGIGAATTDTVAAMATDIAAVTVTATVAALDTAVVTDTVVDTVVAVTTAADMAAAIMVPPLAADSMAAEAVVDSTVAAVVVVDSTVVAAAATVVADTGNG
jgi:hypothetical protein